MNVTPITIDNPGIATRGRVPGDAVFVVTGLARGGELREGADPAVSRAVSPTRMDRVVK